jgi:hypothetical protein
MTSLERTPRNSAGFCSPIRNQPTPSPRTEPKAPSGRPTGATPRSARETHPASNAAGVLPGGRRPFRARLPRGLDAVRFGGIARASRTSWRTGTSRPPSPGRSTSRTTPRTRFAERHLASVPSLDLWPQPEARAAGSKIEDRPWHLWIPALVLTDGVAVAEPKDPGDVVGIDEVVDHNSSWHMASLRLLAPDVSYAAIFPSDPRCSLLA